MIMSLIEQLGPWAWVVLGLILIGIEMVAPGAFLVWLGVAALLTGLIDGFVGLSWQASLLLFAGLSILAVLAGRSLTRRRSDETMDEDAFLNRRAASLVNGTFFLSTPIENGTGQMRVGDSVWTVRGPDLPYGSVVRVTGVDGAVLLVEPA